MERRRASLLLAATVCLFAAIRPARGELPMVSASSTEVLQGEIVELKVSGAGFVDVRARLGNESIRFHPAERGSFVAIVGADIEAKPGPLKIILQATLGSGEQVQKHLQLEIKPKAFPREELNVAPSFDQLSREVIERVRREQARLEEVFTAPTAARLWEAPFVQPVAGSITSPFGFRRIVNGVARAPHTGTDLRAPLGTEVVAANHGRVALLGDFFFAGKSVVLDHGAGLFTMYFHLSEFKVAEGTLVRKGEIIALSGMSGRVTGPHLHWAARINNARIDPLELLHKLAVNSSTRSLVDPAATGTENVK
jgi:murein DD-endopeptidase MepM/ murein hydrolase activator NlpD